MAARSVGEHSPFGPEKNRPGRIAAWADAEGGLALDSAEIKDPGNHSAHRHAGSRDPGSKDSLRRKVNP